VIIYYLYPESEDKLHLGIKNKQVHFVLLLVCISFDLEHCDSYLDS